MLDIVKKPAAKKEVVEVEEITEVKKIIKDANIGLKTFQLKPNGLHGEDLFNHMLEYCAQHLGAIEPSKRLYVDITKTQNSVIMPSKEDLTANQIMRDTQGLGAQLKISKRKLDNLGYIHFCGVQNSESRIKRLRTWLKSSETLAEINASTEKEKGGRG